MQKARPISEWSETWSPDLYSGHKNFALCGRWQSGFDHEELADSKSAGCSSYIFPEDVLGVVWFLATIGAFWYVLTSAVDRTSHWHMVDGSWKSLVGICREVRVTSMRNYWIERTLKKWWIVPFGSILSVISTIIGTFLGTWGSSLSMEDVCVRRLQSTTRFVSQIEQLVSSFKNPQHPSFTKSLKFAESCYH